MIIRFLSCLILVVLSTVGFFSWLRLAQFIKSVMSVPHVKQPCLLLLGHCQYVTHERISGSRMALPLSTPSHFCAYGRKRNIRKRRPGLCLQDPEFSHWDRIFCLSRESVYLRTSQAVPVSLSEPCVTSGASWPPLFPSHPPLFHLGSHCQSSQRSAVGVQGHTNTHTHTLCTGWIIRYLVERILLLCELSLQKVVN